MIWNSTYSLRPNYYIRKNGQNDHYQCDNLPHVTKIYKQNYKSPITLIVKYVKKKKIIIVYLNLNIIFFIGILFGHIFVNLKEVAQLHDKFLSLPYDQIHEDLS